jgi:hypothetical protein
MWLHASPSDRVRAHTAGSLYPADILLTTAFHEQLSKYRLVLHLSSHLSKKWSLAHQAYNIRTHIINSEYWTSLVIDHLWKFTANLWRQQIQILTGDSTEERVAILIEKLHQTPA